MKRHYLLSLASALWGGVRGPLKNVYRLIYSREKTILPTELS